jgi:membrane protein DedA with SNARE-associated domain
MNDRWVKVSMTCIAIVMAVLVGCYIYYDVAQELRDNPDIKEFGAPPYPIINLAAIALVALILTIIIYWLGNTDEDEKDK